MTWPVIIGTLLAAYFIYKYFFQKSDEEKFLKNRQSINLKPQNTSKNADKKIVNSRNFVERMKNSDRTMVIIYGSQTGTGEEFSFRIAQNARRYGIKSLVINPEDVDFEELENMKENLDVSKNITVIMCVATYGEGDPTDNFQELYEWLSKEKIDDPEVLSGINYAVFGLGNKTYEYFCEVGKKMDQILEKIGGNRLISVGLGDDNDNIEEDFMKWEEELWQTIIQKYNIDVSKISTDTQNIYKLVEDVDQTSRHYTGEPFRLNSYKTQKKPFQANKNPFLAKIIKNESSIIESKRQNCTRNYMHIEFDLTDSGIRYEAGDHMAVLCPNDEELVNKCLQMLKIENPNEIMSLRAVDEEAPKQHPFPCPTTWKSAFQHYLDISIPPRANVLNSLVQFCSDPDEKEKMQQLATIGSKIYEEFIVNARRGIVHILEDFPSCRPSAELIAQILPRLQPRYYSISSSYRLDNTKISICCVEVDYTLNSNNNRRIKGVATGHLASLKPGQTVPMWVRRSNFKLPFRTNFPVIMIGPGTGIAPYRGFLQERAWSKNKGKDLGKNVLFTGFRTKSADYIYEEELHSYKSQGVLDHLFVAFSRDNPSPDGKKVYVQHLLKEQKDLVWELLEQDCYLYICGDAKNMARDVQEALIAIIMEKGSKSNKEAADHLKKMTNRGRYLLDVWS